MSTSTFVKNRDCDVTEPVLEKTNNLSSRSRLSQIGLYSHRIKQEALHFG